MDATVAIAGGGPAGIMVGFLLARAGVDVVVVEKHADFFRDFRGDTVHPSTMDVLAELDLLDAFLRIPHQDLTELAADVGGRRIPIADFRELPTRRKCITLMPQWDFLNFLSEAARAYPAFRLEMHTEVVDLLSVGGRVTGLRVRGPDGTTREIAAKLVVGADGRDSVVRSRAGLAVVDRGAPIDVLWLRLSRRNDDPGEAFGRALPGKVFIMIDRGEYWQCALVIRKGGFDDLRALGLDAFRARLREIAPFVGRRVEEVRSWDDVKLLTVKVDRLQSWYLPGLLCIGDAAHAMSPIGGVGINLAIQDAVATANVLVPALRRGGPTIADLAAVQRRRAFPADVTQTAQVFLQNQVVGRVLDAGQPLRVPLPLLLLERWPILRRLPAYAVGIGVRPEHVRAR